MLSYFFSYDDKNKDADNKDADNKDAHNKDAHKNSARNKDAQNKDEIVELLLDISNEEKYLLSEEEEVISYGDLNNNDDTIINMDIEENRADPANSADQANSAEQANSAAPIPRPRLVIPETNIVWNTDSGSGGSGGVVEHEVCIETEHDNDQSTLIDNDNAKFMTNKLLIIGSLCGGASIIFYFSIYGFNM